MSLFRPGQAAAIVEEARRKGMVEEARSAVPESRHPAPIQHIGTVKPKPGKKRKEMNKTEQAFARLLEARKNRGEIDRYEFEGIAFRWGGTGEDTPMIYSPDFCVFAGGKLTLIEVKGGHIWDRDLVRFKGCRSQWPEFHWQMWQYAKGEWRQLQ